MNYYNELEGKLEEYEIIFDREVIEKFRTKVIKDCSLILHKDIFSSKGPNINDDLKIINYHKGEKVSVRSNESGINENIYHISYDEYKYPYLVKLIDRLLSGDYSCIDEIYYPNLEGKENPTYQELVKKVSKELEEINNTSEKRHKQLELESLMKVSTINKNQKPVIDYYYILQNLITINLIDTITLEKEKPKKRVLK